MNVIQTLRNMTKPAEVKMNKRLTAQLKYVKTRKAHSRVMEKRYDRRIDEYEGRKDDALKRLNSEGAADKTMATLLMNNVFKIDRDLSKATLRKYGAVYKQLKLEPVAHELMDKILDLSYVIKYGRQEDVSLDEIADSLDKSEEHTESIDGDLDDLGWVIRETVKKEELKDKVEREADVLDVTSTMQVDLIEDITPEKYEALPQKTKEAFDLYKSIVGEKEKDEEQPKLEDFSGEAGSGDDRGQGDIPRVPQ